MGVNPKLLQGTIEHLEAWCIESGLIDQYDDGEVVDPAVVVEIVKRYQGVVESDPCPVLVVEPGFVEKRKQFVVS